MSNNQQIKRGYKSQKNDVRAKGGNAVAGILSMIFGIISLAVSCCFYFFSISWLWLIPCVAAAIVLAVISLGTKKTGRKMAAAGLVMAILSLIPAAAWGAMAGGLLLSVV